MRKMKVPFSILLVLCMLLSFAPFRSQASADQEDWEWYWRRPVTRWQTRGGWWEAPGRWYQVDFSPVQIPVENSPSATTAGNATVAGSTTRLVATSFSYYYNEWARTLIVRGTGEMPSFSKEHPAPWANLKDKVSRVILERNITTISSYAFVDFLKLKSVVLPATLKTIDPDAFIWSDEVRASKQFQPLDRLEQPALGRGLVAPLFGGLPVHVAPVQIAAVLGLQGIVVVAVVVELADLVAGIQYRQAA